MCQRRSCWCQDASSHEHCKWGIFLFNFFHESTKKLAKTSIVTKMHLLAVSVLRDKSCQVNVWYWWFIGLTYITLSAWKIQMRDTLIMEIWLVQSCIQVVWGWFVMPSFYDDTCLSWRVWSVPTWQFFNLQYWVRLINVSLWDGGSAILVLLFN